MMKLSLGCKWFGLALVFGRWGEWHNHDANSVALFPGRLIEQQETNILREFQKTKWFVNIVPAGRWHRVKIPFVMLVLRGSLVLG